MPAGSPEASLSARPCRELRPASANQPRLGRAGRPRRPCLRRSGLLLTSVQQRFAGGQRVQGAGGLHVARVALLFPSRCPLAATVSHSPSAAPTNFRSQGGKGGSSLKCSQFSRDRVGHCHDCFRWSVCAGVLWSLSVCLCCTARQPQILRERRAQDAVLLRAERATRRVAVHLCAGYLGSHPTPRADRSTA